MKIPKIKLKQNWFVLLFSKLCNRNKKETFSTIKTKILSFSQYRIANALFLQKSLIKDINPEKNSIEYQLGFYYVDYLLICGIDVRKLFSDIGYKCNERYYSYNININNNLIDIMDHITDNDYLFKKYNL